MKNPLPKLTLLFAFVLAATFTVEAQRASPATSAEGMIGKSKVTIKYSQPSVKGRQIWGGLVPYNAVWRTGANEATVFTTTGDITVGGETLAAGTYGLWSIPSEKEFTWIFSEIYDTWGTNYDSSKDVLRVTGPMKNRDNMEKMTFLVEEGKITLHWADRVATLEAK